MLVPGKLYALKQAQWFTTAPMTLDPALRQPQINDGSRFFLENSIFMYLGRNEYYEQYQQFLGPNGKFYVVIDSRVDEFFVD
jgi:hypothetical protein